MPNDKPRNPQEQHSDYSEKTQHLKPRNREPISQGQQFDEMQRQEKNPDGSPKSGETKEKS